MIEDGTPEEIVPRRYWKYVGGAPCSAYRFHSLAAPEVQAVFQLNAAPSNVQRVTMTTFRQTCPNNGCEIFGSIPLGRTPVCLCSIAAMISMFLRLLIKRFWCIHGKESTELPRREVPAYSNSCLRQIMK